MYAVIDIGSNSIRLSLYKLMENKINLIFNKKEMAGLASYITRDHVMSEAGIAKAVEVLRDFKVLLENIDLKEVFVFATAPLRNITNSAEAAGRISQGSGFSVQVLTGSEEAVFDYFGAVQSVDMQDGLLVDIGGGSTELVFFHSKEVVATRSLPIGSLNTYTRFVNEIIPTAAELRRIEKATTTELKTIQLPDHPIDTTRICGVGGTARASYKLCREIFGHGTRDGVFDCIQLKAILSLLETDQRETVSRILKTVPERIHTIAPGMAILRTIAARYNSTSVTVSSKGVREGYLYYILQERGEIHD